MIMALLSYYTNVNEEINCVFWSCFSGLGGYMNARPLFRLETLIIQIYQKISFSIFVHLILYCIYYAVIMKT